MRIIFSCSASWDGRGIVVKVTRRQACAIAGGSLLLASPATAKDRAVDEAAFVPIGGIDQWIAIQGQNARRPAILFLHGGPAEAQSPFLREFRPWEQEYTVVNWDQRGAGRTYGRNGPATPGMTVERMADDAIEVAQYACRRLHKARLILVGHSWGAILGLHAIKRRPDLFCAFVGTGQPVSWTLTLLGQEAWARRQATAAGDQATLKALDAAAQLPPGDWRRLVATNKYRMAPSDLAYLGIQRAFMDSRPTRRAAMWPTGSPAAPSRCRSSVPRSSLSMRERWGWTCRSRSS